mgnify:CR=1 FL=1
MSKKQAARDPAQETEVLNWIESILGTKVREGNKSYEDILQNGIILCKVINVLQPGSINEKKIDTTGTPFKTMQNITNFNDAIKKYGVPVGDTFQTTDLFEKKDVGQVTRTLYALGRTCQTHPEYISSNKPVLGPKLSVENKREFTEEQIAAGKTVIGLQAGFNKGASQAGMNMGNSRHIVD